MFVIINSTGLTPIIVPRDLKTCLGKCLGDWPKCEIIIKWNNEIYSFLIQNRILHKIKHVVACRETQSQKGHCSIQS